MQMTSQHPDIMHGALVFAGTRVPVDMFIDYLKAGETLEDFLDAFPTVQRTQLEGFLQEALTIVKLQHNARAA